MGRGGQEDDRSRPELALARDDPSRPSRFAERFVRESSRIEDLILPKEVVREPWTANGCLHLLAYRDCVEHALGDRPLAEGDIKRWQGAITKEQIAYGFRIAARDIGEYRTVPVHIAGPEGAPAHLVGGLLRELVADINAFPGGDPEVVTELAARAHLRYERIHPFIDGNGRSGRLVALWVLVRHAGPPVVFTADDRRATYYNCFDDVSASDMTAYFRSHRVEPDRLL